MIKSFRCCPLYWQQEGGETVTDILITFLVSVLASVAGYYICKWLDSDDNDSN